MRRKICEGLELSGLLSYIRKYPIFCRKIFVMENEVTFEKKQSQFFFSVHERSRLDEVIEYFAICHWLYEGSAVENGKRYYLKILGK